MPYIQMDFACPKCGGHTFSSYNCTIPANMVRYCTFGAEHGKANRCPFEFPQRDDWKYFKIPGVRAFKNEDEYDLVLDLIRSTPIVGGRR
jgi:hypothetical protein